MRRGFVFGLVVVGACKLHGTGGGDAGSGGGLITTLATLVSFEGEIEMRSRSASGALGSVGVATVFKIKGPKMRTEMSALGVDYVSITDMAAKKTTTLDNKMHTYTESDLSAKPSTAASKPKSTTKVVATNRHDTVAGYSCDVYEIDDTSKAPGAAAPIEICVASGISMLAFGLSGPFSYFSNASSDDAWSQITSKGFPLRIAMRDASGAPLMTLEATRVEKKSEPDTLFEVPAGYRKMTTPSFLAPPTTTATSP